MSAEIAAAASVAQGVLGFKGNRALARQAKQLGEYQEAVIKNEAEVLARRRTHISAQSVMHSVFNTQAPLNRRWQHLKRLWRG
jgi:hypothetical protein